MKLKIAAFFFASFVVVFSVTTFFALAQAQQGIVDYTSSVPKDSDLDGLTDQGEIQIFHTNPGSADTDNDGYVDGEEILLGSDPLDPQDPGHFIISQATDEGGAAKKEIPWTWYVARATGLEAYLLLFAITVLGVGLYTQFIFPVFRSENALVFHKYLSIFTFVIVLAHILALMLDEFMHFKWYEALIPFLSHFQNLYVSLGIIALYLFIIIVGTSMFLRDIYPRFWRKLHYLVYPLFILSFLHGVLVGTDTSFSFVKGMYWVTGITGLLMMAYRVAYPRLQKMQSCIVTNIFIDAGDVAILEIAREDGKEFPEFKPGQYAGLALKDAKGVMTRKHYFSLASSPASNKTVVRFGIKVKGDFTQSISKMSPGDKLSFWGPYGDFIFDDAKMQRTVFIAGGIGITPFVSALRYALDKGLSNELILLFSNRTRQATPFLEELRILAQKNPLFKVFFSVSKEEDAPEEFLKGNINELMIRNCLGNNLKNTYFFICGPVPFMDAMIHTLRKAGVSQEYIRKEQFTAY